MDIFDTIDDFFETIKDPRNISPTDFAKYYPDKYNPKSLNNDELYNYFDQLQKFNKTSEWKGFKPLTPKIVKILLKVDSENKDFGLKAMAYFVSVETNANAFSLNYAITDGILSKVERNQLLASYSVFFGNIKSVVLLEMNAIISNIQKHHFYCEIGALFAQDFIKKTTVRGLGATYFYQSKEFSSVNSLSDYIREEVLKTSQRVRPYIKDTLNNNGEKNLFKKTQLNKIIEYCNEKKIVIAPDFQNKIDILKNMNQN
ncbi:hypothetical protein [Maribacter sp. R86514]|uniref:hypothetical protein n=1 Tax=Maribacter sp. R86514 TaxID=3093854 RepID=UPI0037CBFBA8